MFCTIQTYVYQTGDPEVLVQQENNMPNKYAKDTKKFTFYAKDNLHADFKIRMQFHSLTQSEFLRACVQAVVQKDAIMEIFIEDYKEMMKEQAETKPGTTIEVSQLKMAKRVASALIKLFNSIEIEGNHFAPLMLSLPGVQSAFGTIPAPTGVAPSPATIVAPFPPIPGTNKGQFGVKVGKGKLIP